MAAGLLAISITLLARWISVASVVAILRLSRPIVSGDHRHPHLGRLARGISVALALSLASSPDRNIIVAMTYATVIFSIIVQGLTVGKVTAYFVQKATAAGAAVTARDARSLS
jgi:CPA1 family monovalent cation:H+ antiporter